MQQELTIDDRGLMTDYLFVYGTLKPEVAPAEIAAVMRQLRSLGRGTIRGFLYDLGEYPGVRLASGGGEVEGEIVEFNDAAILKPLDAYEGYNPEAPGKGLFVRRRCQVHLKEGNLFGWVYEYNRQPPSSRQVSTWPPGK